MYAASSIFGKTRKSQAVSLDIVASAMQSVQGSWWAGLGNNLQVTTTSLVVREEKVVAPVARTFCLQWDSTSQRFRSLINNVATASGRQTRAPLGQEVMVAHGAMCSLLDVASPWRVETQPFYFEVARARLPHHRLCHRVGFEVASFRCGIFSLHAYDIVYDGPCIHESVDDGMAQRGN